MREECGCMPLMAKEKVYSAQLSSGYSMACAHVYPQALREKKVGMKVRRGWALAHRSGILEMTGTGLLTRPMLQTIY